MINIGDCNYIGKFYGFVETPAYIKLVVEYLKGHDLKNYLAPIKKVQLTIKQKIKILLDAAEGLAYLHGKKILHRDIKSGNVGINNEITEGSLEFTAKIFDFGVSKEEDNKSAATHVSGTIKYNAPEQTKDVYTNKVDIFAFAMMAFELFSERICYSDPKYSKLNDTALTNYVRVKDLRPDAGIKPKQDTPQEMIDMYKKNWSKDPENRMTAEELRDFLRNYYESL